MMAWSVFHKSPQFRPGDLLRVEKDALCDRVEGIALGIERIIALAAADEQNAAVLSYVSLNPIPCLLRLGGLVVYLGSYYDHHDSGWEGHICLYHGMFIDAATVLVRLSRP